MAVWVMSVHNAYAAGAATATGAGEGEESVEGAERAIPIERGECREWIQSAVCCICI